MTACFDVMLELVQYGAAIALECRALGLEIGYKGDFGQAVTQADLAISALLRDRLGPRLIEEESAKQLRPADARAMLASDDWSFVADPIDGTAAYAAGLTSWAVMIAACRSGWPVMSVIHLPLWTTPQLPEPAAPTGLIVAAMNGDLLWATSAQGRIRGDLRRFVAPDTANAHVGWLAEASRRHTLDYRKAELLPQCSGSFAADAVSLALGRLEATTFNFSLWDLVPTVPILEAAGFGLHRWPDLVAPPRASVADLFRDDFGLASELLLICRSRGTTERLASAIRPAPAASEAIVSA